MFFLKILWHFSPINMQLTWLVWGLLEKIMFYSPRSMDLGLDSHPYLHQPPIQGDPIPGEDLCTHCERCINQCPVNAIPKNVETTNNSSNSYRAIDKIACATRSKMLRKDYKSPCGICIKVCPVGMDRKIFNREDMSIYTDNSKYKKAWDHVKKYGSR